MPLRYPAPLQPGDRVGVTSPSSGVAEFLRPRLDVAIETVRGHGYEVVVGECMDGSSHISAPAADRARELTAMLTDPTIRAVVPPWGGEMAIDLLPLLDWDAIAAAEPTWVVGYSDMSTIITPLTLRAGVATIHGNNLMDTPFRAPDGLLTWLDIVSAPTGATLRQDSPGRYRKGMVDYVQHPEVSEYTLDQQGRWRRLDGTDDVDVTGRLIGGCVEMLSHFAGSAYGDASAFAREHASDEGLLVYIEASENGAFDICRALHGMRLRGFFDAATAVIVGRTSAPASRTLTQDEAVLDALGGLGVPIVADVECGHVAPYLAVVNGARGRLVCSETENSLVQTLV